MSETNFDNSSPPVGAEDWNLVKDFKLNIFDAEISTPTLEAALDTVGERIKKLQTEIDDGGGYTREKEERNERMGIFKGATQFLENRLPGQTIAEWEAVQLEHIAEMLRTDIIADDTMYDRSIDEIDLAKGLLIEAQQQELDALPDTMKPAVELLQPAKPEAPGLEDDSDECVDGNGRHNMQLDIIKAMSELEKNIGDETYPSEIAKLKAKFTFLGRVKRVAGSFEPDDGDTLGAWYDRKLSFIEERLGLPHTAEDAKADFEAQRDALKEAKQRLSMAISSERQRVYEANVQAKRSYAGELQNYYSGSYLSPIAGTPNSAAIGTRRLTPEQESEVEHAWLKVQRPLASLRSV